jgi:hypothetical protein
MTGNNCRRVSKWLAYLTAHTRLHDFFDVAVLCRMSFYCSSDVFSADAGPLFLSPP